MNIQTTIPISEARRKIFDIAEKVQSPSVYYVLTENGRPKAVVLSASEFESWVETLEVMADFPDLANDAKAARRDYRSGDYVTLENLLSKPRANALPSRPAKKSPKGPR